MTSCHHPGGDRGGFGGVPGKAATSDLVARLEAPPDALWVSRSGAAGLVTRSFVNAGDRVAKGTPLLLVEGAGLGQHGEDEAGAATIYAGDAGVVLEVLPPGQRVRPGDLLVRVADTAELVARVAPPAGLLPGSDELLRVRGVVPATGVRPLLRAVKATSAGHLELRLLNGDGRLRLHDEYHVRLDLVPASRTSVE